jgi:hypothetical protein
MINLPWYTQVFALKPILVQMLPAFLYRTMHK